MFLGLLAVSASWAAPSYADPPLEIVLPHSEQADRGGGMVAVNRRGVGLKGDIVSAFCESDAIVPRTAGRDLVIQFVGDLAAPTECQLVTTHRPDLVKVLRVREMTAAEQREWDAAVRASTASE